MFLKFLPLRLGFFHGIIFRVSFGFRVCGFLVGKLASVCICSPDYRAKDKTSSFPQQAERCERQAERTNTGRGMRAVLSLLMSPMMIHGKSEEEI